MSIIMISILIGSNISESGCSREPLLFALSNSFSSIGFSCWWEFPAVRWYNTGTLKKKSHDLHLLFSKSINVNIELIKFQKGEKKKEAPHD